MSGNFGAAQRGDMPFLSAFLLPEGGGGGCLWRLESGRKPNSLSPNEIRRNFTLQYSSFLPIRYLYNESVTIQSVMTALTTLYAAHKYMCPGLARIVVNYLREHLSEKNVLLVLQVIAHQTIIRMFC